MRVFCVPYVDSARALVARARATVVFLLAALFAVCFMLSSAASLHAQATPPCTQEYWCGMGLYPGPALEARGVLDSSGVDASAAETSTTGAAENPAPLAEDDAKDFAQQMLVFQSLRDGNWEIYLSRLDGVGRTRLTANEAIDSDPRLSPTMQNIAFVSDRDAEGIPNIYIMNLDGSNVRRLTREWGATGPRWTPDGAYIYFTAWNVDDAGKVFDYDIKRVRVADGFVQTIVGGATIDFDVALKFDGSELVWVRPIDGENGVLIRAKPDGSGARVFGPAHRHLGKPAWSPSGFFLSFEWANEEGWNTISAHYFYNLFDDEDGSQNIVWIAGGGANSGPWIEFTGSSWTHSYYSATGISAMHDDRLLYTTYSYQVVENKVVVSRRMAMAQYDSGLFQLLDELSPLSDTTLDTNPNARWIDTTPPVTALYPLPAYSTASSPSVRWLNQDTGGSGMLRADIQLSDAPCCKWEARAEKLPTDWLWACYFGDFYPAPPFTLNHPFYRVRTVDRALNVSAWSAPDSTQCYFERIQSTVTDVRGYPIAGVRYGTGATPPQFITVQNPSSLLGQMSALTWYNSDLFHLSVTHPIYGTTAAGSLSDIYGNYTGPSTTYFVSPVGPNLIDDGGFDAGYNSPNWQWTWTFVTNGTFGGFAAGFSAQEPVHASTRVEQVIPAGVEWTGMVNPTLTFAYRFNGQAAVPPFDPTGAALDPASPEHASVDPLEVAAPRQPYFEVIVRETATVSSTEIVTDTVVLRRTTPLTDWRIAWVDMTPWRGKTITVLFALQNPDLVATDLFAVVDQVALSPWRTPVVSAMTPTAVADPAGATLTLTSTNLIGAPKVQLLRSSTATSGTPVAAGDDPAALDEIILDPTSVIRNGDTLTATLPASLVPGVYNVLVINPGGDRSFAPQTLTVGDPVYLPRISQ